MALLTHVRIVRVELIVHLNKQYQAAVSVNHYEDCKQHSLKEYSTLCILKEWS